MDAFWGFVRGIRGKSEDLGVVSVEMQPFSSQFSPLGDLFLARPFWLSPNRSVTDSSKTARLHSRQVRFLIGTQATA